jgi:hypothetical protein
MTVGRIPVIEGGIQPTIFDAKGDLLTATANDTPARLAVGANTAVLVADSTQSTGLKWDGVWTSYTPTYLNLTPGNGTVTARYRQVGKTVEVSYRLLWGSTTSCGNYPIFSYPVTPANNNNVIVGNAALFETGVGTWLGLVFCDAANGLLTQIQYTGGTWLVDGVLGAATPTTWTTGDIWTMTATYEAA